VDGLVSNHIHNNLPIYLLYLPQMHLVHRSDIEKLVQPAILDIVNAHRTIPAPSDEEICQMVEKNVASYAIFSHRWLKSGELTFQDLLKLKSITAAGFSQLLKSPTELMKLSGTTILDKARKESIKCGVSAKEGIKCDDRAVLEKMEEICEWLSNKNHKANDFVKLVKFCKKASEYQCNFVWLDTGCIDKDSSAELEESIRSMFKWYKNSRICIIHLGETTSPSNMQQDPWFTRGWTLQELLAPQEIKFFSRSWVPLTQHNNDKKDDKYLKIPLWEFISRITKIPVVQLLEFEPGTKSNIREKMVWMSKRTTTRIEDMAYCLIGIFNIPLSIAYGEGQMAFYRLQVEILQHSHDRGLFVWNGLPSSHNTMFAAGPKAFFSLEGSQHTIGEDVVGPVDPTYMLTNYGLHIPLSIYDMNAVVKQGGKHQSLVLKGNEVIKDGKLMIGILGNITGKTFLAIVLKPISSMIGSKQQQFNRVTTYNVIELEGSNWKAPEVVFIK
jgi:Heterokaryon incompatibility protein (HET)